ncbi:hypothetical protein ESCO_001418 [Escovopsis weberi]|uniref:DNA polymerase alpha subunit B n=1 Tax=Escovopsis weberi TaxID=150374 RepID=A0A0M9VTZ3_ESCWE|nr:hypothetical protein ESCO_001418 [Escovopsis weberi]
MADPNFSSLSSLYDAIEAKFSTTSLGNDKWLIPTIACFVYHDPESLKNLYLHLIHQPAYASSTARQALVRRIREALFKSIIIIGVCKPIEAILAIADVERDEDKDYTFTRQEWQADDQNMAMAQAWFGKVYSHNGTPTLDRFAAHKDFSWLSQTITYGLFLSDRQVLDDVDTQLVVLPSIASQNLPTESRWHIRGTRRIGVSKKDVQTLCDIAKTIAEHYNVKLDRVPKVDDVENEV